VRELAGEDGTIGELANDFMAALQQGAQGEDEGEDEGGMGGEDEAQEDEYDSEGFDEP
jgi:hypothetical protein